MELEESLNQELWTLLSKIKKATLSHPSNYPVLPDEELLYQIELESIEDFRHFSFLHHEKAVFIDNPADKGFGLDHKFPFIIMFSLGKNFESTYSKYSLLNKNSQNVTIRLNLRGKKLILETPDASYSIYTFKTDSDPFKIFSYLMNNEDKRLKFSTVKMEADAVNYQNTPSELARISGFSKQLKDYFIPIRTKTDILLRKSADVSQEELIELAKLYS